MNEEKFRKQYLGEVPVLSKYMELLKIAKEYHNTCEAYDRSVCRVIKRGEAIPITRVEFDLVNKNALIVKESLMLQVRVLGYNSKNFNKAIREASFF